MSVWFVSVVIMSGELGFLPRRIAEIARPEPKSPLFKVGQDTPSRGGVGCDAQKIPY